MKPGYVGPLLLLAIGFILFFNNTGSLPWEIWGSLWHYWPLILILSGMQILARHSESSIMYILAVILSILLILAAVFLAWNGYPAPDTIEKNLRWSILNNSHLDGNNFDYNTFPITSSALLKFSSEVAYDILICPFPFSPKAEPGTTMTPFFSNSCGASSSSTSGNT